MIEILDIESGNWQAWKEHKMNQLLIVSRIWWYSNLRWNLEIIERIPGYMEEGFGGDYYESFINWEWT